jgi:hypothetical protein
MFAGKPCGEGQLLFYSQPQGPGTLVVDRAIVDLSKARLQLRTQQTKQICSPQTEKKEKSPAKPRWEFKRGVICGQFPSDFRQNPVCYLR